MRTYRKPRNPMFLFGGRIITIVATISCILAMFTWQDFVGPVEAVQPDDSVIGDRIIEEEPFVPGEVLVLLSVEADANSVAESGEYFSGIESSVKGDIVRRITFSGGKEVLRVKLPTGKSVEDAISEHWEARDRRIVVVEPNYRVRIARIPNDPLFPQLWGMNNTGQTGGREDADIDAPEAWDIATGVPEASDVIVGVIDSGVDYLHPDLINNMWVNPGEIPGNGIDDDGNGYIDDIYGYDFYQNDGDPSDAAGHGTHVSGTIAGIGDNGLGVAGVNWRCKLMALRFIDARGFGNTSGAIEAINYAVANGAKILNNSWGGGGYSESLETAITEARDNGVLFVAAAGNSGVDTDSQPHYPSSYEVSNVISVAATDDEDSLASFSNYGAESVDLGAPGVSILSTIPKYRTVFFEDFQGAITPGFGGTQMSLEGIINNRWGTVLVPIPDDQNNIAARGDWQNSWPYFRDSSGSIVTSAIDTRGLRGLTLDFEFRFEIGNGDELTAYVWDSTTWQEVFSIASKCCYREDFYFSTLIDIPESYRHAEMKVRFQWATDGEDNNYFGGEIDNIRIQCIDDHMGSYAWFNGTSMATPHVVGVAALVMANVPGSASTTMSLDELKSRIVWTGDPIPALNGRTVSGRRLNAYNALTASPGVTVVAPNGGESWELLSKHDIEWYSIGTGSVFDIYLYKGGSFYALLAEDVPSSGKFTWEIPVSLPSDSDYRIRITGGTYSDESDEDFELFCPAMIKPSYPDPCNGASDVTLDTDLIWNVEELKPVTITFDELPYGTTVDGMVIEDVTFGFSSSDANINGGPGDIYYIQQPNIEGEAAGTLTLDFAVPVFDVSYGFAMSAIGFEPNATTMVLIDSSLIPIGTFSADADDMGFYFIEGMNRGTSTTPIAHAVITFSHPDAELGRFALDNLTYSPIPGGLSEAAATGESGGRVEGESGEHADANGTNVGFQSWIESGEFGSMQPAYLLSGVRTGVESGVKESAAPEAIAMEMSVSTGELHSGGPDAGNYIFIDNNEPNGPSFDWIEIAAPPPPPPPPPGGTVQEPSEPTETISGIHMGLDDDSAYFPIELPFSFYFYGNNYNRVAVGSNGTIYFEDQYLGFNNCCIPCNTGYNVQRFIAVYWDDLDPNPVGADNVYYSIVGQAPNRILVVQWENVSHFFSEDDRVTCQAQLFEGSSDILLLYADPSSEAGSLATVGIQRDRETGLNYMCNEEKLHPGLAVLFRYMPPCPATWDVYFGTNPNAMELIESDLTDPNCDPTPNPGETLKRGTRYFWQVVVKNCCGAIDSNEWSFTTVNTPPAADAGDDRTVVCACNSEQGTQVILDGTRSSDADETPLTYMWTGPFLESPAQGATPTVTLDSGCPDDYVITLIVNDGIVDSEPNEVVITVVYTSPPSFEFSVAPTFLWPPSHKMVEITPSWTVSDCDAAPEVSLFSIVMSDDANTVGDGQTTGDIETGDDGSIYVRSERSGTNSSRLYTITYQAVDDFGNVSVRSATVRIPHDFKVLGRIAERWLLSGPAGSIQVDFNRDGIVNLTDFARFAENWIK